jgi:hypothetical protein
MYIDEIADKVRQKVPISDRPVDAERLYRMYAVLVRAKGQKTTASDVHDAWSAWMADRNSSHESLIEFDSLSSVVQEQDSVYLDAIHKVAAEIGAQQDEFHELLFPLGQPTAGNRQQVLDIYRIIVQSSESLVGRRQAVNTFFLTMNGVLFTASGLVLQHSSGSQLNGIGILILSVAGAILCGAWRSLISSFGQLNKGKFKVINAIENRLPVAIYAAEWEALGRGEDPRVYRTFTSREIWVPNALLVLHSLAAVLSFLFVLGLIPIVIDAPVEQGGSVFIGLH